jgi:cytochrome oxidase Cu insertion factor (SCO1/SenC/PrrC family)
MTLGPRAKLLLIASGFVLPIVLSLVAYRFLRADPTGNYGELLLPPARAPALAFDMGRPGAWSFDQLQGRWALVSSDSGRCAEACVRKLTLVRQVQLALGRNAARVARVYIVDDQAPPQPALLAQFEGTVVASTPRGAILAAGAGADRAHIYLVDPHGNVMMRWPADADQKRMLRDLERLLKASQIGHNDGLLQAVPC